MEWLCERSILTPKNDQAAAINDTAVVNIDDVTNYPVEFLNSLKPPGMPHHRLILRVGTPIILLQNLKSPKLCNRTRL
jgi:ATP-dependent DNA helicase PIF1